MAVLDRLQDRLVQLLCRSREEAEKTRNAPNNLKMETTGRKKENGLEEKKAAVMLKVM